MTKHQYNLGIIGNCAYLALIDTTANVRWLCWPKFDSSFVFGNLLDDERGGEFSVRPSQSNFQTKQYYLENTNVLCTEFDTGDAQFRVTDFAPRFYQNDRYYKPLMLIRKIEPLRGTPTIKVVCEPRGEYGQTIPEKYLGSNHIRYIGLEQSMRLTTNVSLSYIMDQESFVLNETKYLVLTYGIPLEAPIAATAEEFLQRTIRYWRSWITSTSIGNFQQAQIIRSALALKIHQYEDTGAIIAAPTTSLPEFHLSTRNWDYRYCWMRDSYYTLTAFNNLGHFEELRAYFEYIENVTKNEEDRFQPMYKINAQKDIEEIEMPLKGYLGNQPVRVGNAAYKHIQNDVYGQVLVSLLPFYSDRRLIAYHDKTPSKRLVQHALNKIGETMDQPDAGLWEFRNLKQLHCYTFLFHWAGSCAGYKIAQFFKDEGMAKQSLKLKAEAEKRIRACWNPDFQAFTQAIGAPRLDASCLQLITMNFLDPSSDEAKRHLIALEKELKTPEGLFFRYKHTDDFGAPETTFLICAYWYVEALACVGRLDEAMELFERFNQYTNHLGLLSEDVDAKTGSQWGNFPQAYSHVGQVNAAYRIAKKLDEPNFF